MSHREKRPLRVLLTRTVCVATATGATLLAGAGLAAAHVTVDAPDAAQGGYGVLTFRVPTESATAGTTKLTVTLPHLKSAMTEPLPGWTATVTKDPATAEATSVTWAAAPGVMVAPGQFQQFALEAGPLPKTETVSFPAEQTYSDGKIVAWNQPTNADGSEPEHPAPSLTLAPEGSKGGEVAGMSASSGSSSSSDTAARWLGGVGLVLGALALAIAIGSLRRNRS